MTKPPRTLSRRATLLACAAALALAPGLQPAGHAADVEFDDDASTIVSSDGRSFPAPPMGLSGSPPFAGTGVLPESAHRPFARPPNDLRPMEMAVEIPAASTQSVLGTDTRTQVMDTTIFPYRALVFLEVDFPLAFGFQCTGFFIAADTIATAGHCVYSDQHGGWASSIVAYPGRNGDTFPYGSVTATTLFSVAGWTDDEDHRYDYGALKIDGNLGDTTGWLGYGVKDSDAALLDRRAKIYGYPGDKSRGTMWGMARKVKGVDQRKLFYNLDTFGGQSGSPIFGRLSNGCKPCAFGIHAYGIGANPYPRWNSGTRVNQAVFDALAFLATQ